MPARYAELLGEATGIAWSEELWLDDVDRGFYVASYLRAWALEAQLARRTCASASASAGSPSRRRASGCAGLWSEGQRLRADELLAESLGEELRFEALAGEFA